MRFTNCGSIYVEYARKFYFQIVPIMQSERGDLHKALTLLFWVYAHIQFGWAKGKTQKN